MTLKIYLLSSCSWTWITYYPEITVVNNSQEADYILYEKSGDYQHHVIENIKAKYPREKLVFILDTDTNDFFDDISVWFTCSTNGSLKKRQTQMFCTQQMMFSWSSDGHDPLDVPTSEREIDIYFRGSVWTPRQPMFDYFSGKPGCYMENFLFFAQAAAAPNKEEFIKSSTERLYKDLTKSKLSLCPRGGGLSSMRLPESLACGSIPVLIDDFTAPYGIDLTTIGLAFDTSVHTMEHIYNECQKLLQDPERIEKYRQAGAKLYKEVIAHDLQNGPYIGGESGWGPSHLIVEKLKSYL
jgi:hypothetical protein